MTYSSPSITQRPNNRYLPLLLIIGLSILVPAAHAMTDQVPREQDIVDLRLGQRITVDDGTCPAGQIKEVSGARMSPTGIVRAQKCISRMGTKKR